MDLEAREAFEKLTDRILALHEDVRAIKDWCERHDAEHRTARVPYRRTPTPPPISPVSTPSEEPK